MLLRFPEDVDDIVEDLRHTNAVFTNGCFDMMHPGHLAVIRRCVERAQEIYGVVVVGVDTDASVEARKGPGRPVFPQLHRASLIAAIRDVSMVVLFSSTHLEALINTVNPVRVVKGGDYRERDVVSGGRPVEIVPFVEGWSTTNVIQSIR